MAFIGEMLYFGGIYVALLSSPGAGALFAGAVHMVTRRRRSRHTARLMIAGVFTALVIGVAVDVVVFGGLFMTSPVMWIFVFLAATTAYSMMK
ncbi:MAG: hypothetical protein IPK16_24480 [Anaerolineales bacterium]|nr:hypothetical protein [Anaerolineales bacterium]